MEVCRTCGSNIAKNVSKNIYKDPENVLLKQIELVTGVWLEYAEDLPTFICSYCLVDLQSAIGFREKCIIHQRKLLKKIFSSSSMPENADPLKHNSNTYLQEKTSIGNDSNNVKKHNMKDILEECVNDVILQGKYNHYDLEKQMELKNSIIDDEKAECVDSNIMNKKSVKLQQLKKNKEANIKRKFIRWNKLTEAEAKELHNQMRKRDYICDQCGRHFTDHSNFKLHLLRHTGIKNFQCKICMLRFYTSHLLRRHAMVHSKVPLHICQYCDKTSNNKQNIIKHERTHTKEKPYSCRSCDKNFSINGALKNHTVIHTGIRRFHCETCDRWFLLRKVLKQHYRSKTHEENMCKQQTAVAPM